MQRKKSLRESRASTNQCFSQAVRRGFKLQTETQQPKPVPLHSKKTHLHAAREQASDYIWLWFWAQVLRGTVCRVLLHNTGSRYLLRETDRQLRHHRNLLVLCCLFPETLSAPSEQEEITHDACAAPALSAWPPSLSRRPKSLHLYWLRETCAHTPAKTTHMLYKTFQASKNF